MIDYETFCRIKHLHEQEGLSLAQIARALSLDPRTVRHWMASGRFRRRQQPPRPSKLDPYKRTIRQLIETHPYTAVQIHQRLREAGYAGGITILKDYLRTVRPRRAPAFLTLAFAPGECAQVDWGHYGTVNVGNTRRRLSFFVMVLCYSRLMYVEFTVSQTMEHFLASHLHAFECFGGLVPEKIMVDNLKSAVLQRLTGQAPVFNPRYLDFAQHVGFSIAPCNLGAGHEKGRVESGVGYVKKNLLSGLEIPDFSTLNPAARVWLDTVANVRIHGETRERPLERFEAERPHLRTLPPHDPDIGTVHTVRASNRFRVTFETNRYSVPAEYASQRLTLKAYPERICIYHQAKLIARHRRSYERHRDFEDPDHPKALLAQRRSARAQRLLQRFLALSPNAELYYAELGARRFNPRHHVHKIVALSEIYGIEALARALEDACHFQAFSSEYIANLLESRARAQPQASPLHLTRHRDLLELELPEPDLSLYDADQDDNPRDPA
ncbi:MAG: IS21 family transposase [Gammaproteobacteria bacterium]|nr:IS21 family transposase [Gammaproteobacteria bacterium]NIR82609.1 IS21 family transposase [Gammaproteobacteria bacterium]NIR88968.1 IS21 family transposase [Gammaproteobacteria bacterium]NIU03741.1 IS21 family transposase [Gammaproteobacteria bacterium]NIV74171.1 IS21 family transposase [Gammaproteobacteria bacterium]